MSIFTLSNVTLDLPDDILSPDLINWLNRGTFEREEARAISQFVTPDDVVMEIGAGVGFVSISAARIVGGQNVIAIEANPKLLPIMKANFALNKVVGATLLNYAVVANGNARATLYLNRAFWASSLLESNTTPRARVEVPAISLEALLAKWHPTVLVCDVEGSEKDFFQAPLPPSVRLIILELHPSKYSSQALDTLLERLAAIGFAYVFFDSPDDVVCFARQ
ncbi:MAG: FkbM family methyltransferase [Rhodobacteraceae bacterium]|nr:FkbM family methyltransferase [Paracoccaceae bacterium]